MKSDQLVRENKMISQLKRCLYWLLLALPATLWGAAAEANAVTDIDFVALPDDRFEVRLAFSGQPPQPKSYEIAQPARLVLDFAQVQSALDKKKYPLPFTNARDAVVVSDGSRTRLIINLVESAPFQTAIEGNSLVLQVGASGAAQRVERDDLSGFQPAAIREDQDQAAGELNAAVTGIDFRRDAQGAGLILIDLSDPSINIDIEKTGKAIQLSFYQTELPGYLDRRLDVVDFATPVSAVDAVQVGSATIITIEADGQYDYLAYQADNQYMVSVKPQSEAEIAAQANKFDFSGDRLSLNFQDIEVRSVLQLIADFTSLNLVASDTVTGSITLRLDQVPWDQALAIVLKAKGLDKRQEGNVLMVAPAAEIAEQERLQVEANKQLQELAPLETAFVRIKYADAAKIFELFTADDQQSGDSGGASKDGNATNSILSARGSAIVDERTNTIILTDTEDKISEFQRLIAEIDVPIKQVLIEARIVIANTDFKKELGATWGLAGIDKISGTTQSSAFGDKTLGFSGRRSGLSPGAGVAESFRYSADEIETDFGPDGVAGGGDDGPTLYTKNYDFGLGDSLAVDLGVADPTGSFSLGYLTDNFLIDLELSALESDGFGEIVSQPKVLTGDKQQAVIKSGTEIAYEKATSSGATSIEFREAVLQLEVTPQITPDNRIIMDLLEIGRASCRERVSTRV
jgi:type IV pilus assembly protein PilQ